MKTDVSFFVPSIPNVCMDWTALPLQAACWEQLMAMQRVYFYPQSHFQTQMVRYHLLCSARRVWWLQHFCPVSKKLLSEKTFLPWHPLRRMLVTGCLWEAESENTGFQMCYILWWAGIDLRPCHDGYYSLPSDGWVIFQGNWKGVLQTYLLLE